MEVELSGPKANDEGSNMTKRIRWQYKGDVDEGGKRCGSGVLEYQCSVNSGVTTTSITMDGKWQDNVLHGYGILRINGTQIYAGNWFNGNMMLSGPVDVEGARHSANDRMRMKDKNQSDLSLIDIDALEPHIFEAMWMFISDVQSASFLAENKSRGAGLRMKGGKSFMDFEEEDIEPHDSSEIKTTSASEEPRDLAEFVLMSMTWFIGCILIFLLFLS